MRTPSAAEGYIGSIQTGFKAPRGQKWRPASRLGVERVPRRGAHAVQAQQAAGCRCGPVSRSRRACRCPALLPVPQQTHSSAGAQVAKARARAPAACKQEDRIRSGMSGTVLVGWWLVGSWQVRSAARWHTPDIRWTRAALVHSTNLLPVPLKPNCQPAVF